MGTPSTTTASSIDEGYEGIRRPRTAHASMTILGARLEKLRAGTAASGAAILGVNADGVLARPSHPPLMARYRNRREAGERLARALENLRGQAGSDGSQGDMR